VRNALWRGTASSTRLLVYPIGPCLRCWRENPL